MTSCGRTKTKKALKNTENELKNLFRNNKTSGIGLHNAVFSTFRKVGGPQPSSG